MVIPHTPPRTWHPPHVERRGTGAYVGRQVIATRDRQVHGYELLYRAPGLEGLPLDRWPARFQDRATEHVIAVAFHREPDITSPHPGFVNFARSALVNSVGAMGCDPRRMVIEVVESAHADAALIGRLEELRALGFRIALDDFVGTTSQRTLLSYADYVKIDVRDVVRHGPALLDEARQHHVALIAERVEDEPMLDMCVRAGFDLFQGYLFGLVDVLDRGDESPMPADSADRESDAEVSSTSDR